MHLVVDGMNVIGSRPDGWWRDRSAARRQLVDQLVALAASEDHMTSDDHVTVVFDGRPAPGEVAGAPRSGLDVVFAPGGPNAADRAIVRLAEDLARREDVVVVTSDTALAQDVRRLGASVEGAGAFRARLGR